MNPNIYVEFAVYNYKGETSLSGYTLPGNEFTFVANLTGADKPISQQSVTWDLGDGTRTDELSPTHTYNWPGVYNVSLVVYDAAGNAFYSTTTYTLSVYDLIGSELQATNLSDTFVIPAGDYSPFYINRRNSWQTYSALSAIGYTVNLYLSGNNDPVVDLKTYNSDAWAHLRRKSIFFTKSSTAAVTEYIPISSVNTDDILLYAKLDGNKEYQLCSQSETGSVFIGTSGSATVYFTSNTPKNVSVSAFGIPSLIFCTLDTSHLQDAFTYNTNYFDYFSPSIGYINTQSAVLPVWITYSPANRLSFSTNGIDTQGDATLDTFEIPSISWQNTQIPFVLKLKSNNGYSTLFYPLLSSNIVNMSGAGEYFRADFQLLSDSTVLSADFYQDFNSDLPSDAGGYFKGYFVCPVTATNCQIAAIVTTKDPTYYDSQTSTVVLAITSTLYGTSNLFNIYPQTGKYSIAKNNENFDMQGFYNTLRLPEYLVDKDVLFNSFLGSIAGNLSSQPFELGKTVYERIANFCENINDVDTATVQSLVSLCTQYGVDVGEVNTEYPPQLRRIIDMISIKKSKLFGTYNHYDLNFRPVGGATANPGKINLGELIDINTGTFSLSESLVAYNRFYDKHFVVKLPALSGYTGSSTFYLSDYNASWNLGLPIEVPAEDVNGTNIGEFYSFYRYLESTQWPITNSVINWDDSKNTLNFTVSSYTEWVNDDGIMDNLLNYEITKGLRLFTSAVDITYNN